MRCTEAAPRFRPSARWRSPRDDDRASPGTVVTDADRSPIAGSDAPRAAPPARLRCGRCSSVRQHAHDDVAGMAFRDERFPSWCPSNRTTHVLQHRTGHLLPTVRFRQFLTAWRWKGIVKSILDRLNSAQPPPPPPPPPTSAWTPARWPISTLNCSHFLQPSQLVHAVLSDLSGGCAATT